MDIPYFLQNVDFTLLRAQKAELLTITKERTDNNLTGLIYLIDEIQEFAVEIMGMTDEQVFGD